MKHKRNVGRLAALSFAVALAATIPALPAYAHDTGQNAETDCAYGMGPGMMGPGYGYGPGEGQSYPNLSPEDREARAKAFAEEYLRRYLPGYSLEKKPQAKKK